VPVPNSQHNFLAKGFATTIIAGPEAPQLVLMYGGQAQSDFTGFDPVKRAAQSEPLKSLSY
jgi:16S rRNA C1402 (ribose-2'-O) methylase RsmI